MSNASLTVRLSPRIKLAALRQARRDELSLSDVTRMLLKAYARGDIDVEIRVRRKGRGSRTVRAVQRQKVQ